jgi:hypothetical protein
MTTRKTPRLLHLKERHLFFIDSDTTPDIESKAYELVDFYVVVCPKFVQFREEGKTKHPNIKKIEKKIETIEKDDGVYLEITLHVHHYTNTRLYFDPLGYAFKLNSLLNLRSGSVERVIDDKHLKLILKKRQPRPTKPKQIDIKTIDEVHKEIEEKSFLDY